MHKEQRRSRPKENIGTGSNIIFFPEGIPAFEEEKEYYLVPAEEPSPFFFLQSVHSELCLILADPFVFFPDYEIDLPDPLLGNLQAEDDISDLMVFSIVTVGEDPKDSTTNLLAPVIINADTRLGLQFIPEKARYSTKQPLFKRVNNSQPARRGGR